MRRLRTLVVALALTCAAPVPAVAQSVGVGFAGGQPTLQTTIPIRVSGQLTVQFHGDTAAGCARWGLCGYSGTVSWRPPQDGSLIVSRRLGARPSTTVIFVPSFSAGPTVPGGVTTADVVLNAGPSAPPAAHCVDVATTGEFVSLPVRAGRVTVSLAGAGPPLLMTRCAGPRDPDVIPDLPVRSLSVTAVERGHTTISLAASRALSAHGFAGTVSSTIALRLGTPGRTTRASGSPGRPGGRSTRVRKIDVGYRATISGRVVALLRGDANPLLCAPLGSCGLSGTITLTPHAGSGHATLTAEERASRPRRALLAAVGLSGGSAHGVIGFGSVHWSGAGSTVADVVQGSARCNDAARLDSGGMLLTTTRGRLRVSYTPDGFVSGTSGVTHCPGPLTGTTAVAAGSVPVAHLGRGVTTIHLTTGITAADDGYAIRFVPDLTLTLTRLTRRTTVITFPPGELPLARGRPAAQTR